MNVTTEWVSPLINTGSVFNAGSAFMESGSYTSRTEAILNTNGEYNFSCTATVSSDSSYLRGSARMTGSVIIRGGKLLILIM